MEKTRSRYHHYQPRHPSTSNSWSRTMSNLYRRQNGQFSPPSTGDECNGDPNPFYCRPSSGRSDDRTTSSIGWWDDVQAWHATLWRAAVLRSAFNVAANGASPADNELESSGERLREKFVGFPHLPLPLVNASANTRRALAPDMSDDGPSAPRQSTLLIAPTGENGADESRVHPDNTFVCTIPAKLTHGQRIHITVGESTFDVTVTATNRRNPAPNPPDSTSTPHSIFGKPAPSTNLCNEAERSQLSSTAEAIPVEPVMPKPSNSIPGSFTSDIPYRGYMPRPMVRTSTMAFQHSQDFGSSTPNARPFAHALYSRKRAKSIQSCTGFRQRKREISIARSAVSPMPEGSKSACAILRSDFREDGHAAGFSHTVTPSTVDGVNLEEIKRFAKLFKMKRLSLGLTQTQVGQTLSLTNGPAYSQSAICRFEKLDITPKSAQKIKPVLERWLQEVDDQIKVNGGVANMQRTFLSPVRLESKPIHDDPPSTPLQLRVSPANSSPPSRSVQPAETASPETVLSPGAVSCTDAAANCKRRKRRTSFTPQALEVLNEYFDRNSHPSGIEMTALAERLNYEREVIRVWFCNKRQALKNTFKKLKTSP